MNVVFRLQVLGNVMVGWEELWISLSFIHFLTSNSLGENTSQVNGFRMCFHDKNDVCLHCFLVGWLFLFVCLLAAFVFLFFTFLNWCSHCKRGYLRERGWLMSILQIVKLMEKVWVVIRVLQDVLRGFFSNSFGYLYACDFLLRSASKFLFEKLIS